MMVMLIMWVIYMNVVQISGLIPDFLTSSNSFLPFFFVKIFIIHKEFMYFKSTLISSMNIKNDSKMQYMHNVVVARLCIIGTEMSRSPASPNTCTTMYHGI